MNKVLPIKNLDHLNHANKQDQTEEENTKNDDNSNLKTKKIMLVDDEADILWLFKIALESDARLKVDSFADPIVA